VKDGGILNLRQLSSVAVRIAKEARGSASEVLLHLYDGGSLQNTLIISPPGRGKTTLLRDLIRCISDGEGVPPLRVGVSDERGELAAMENGMPRMEIGARTDVMDGRKTWRRWKRRPAAASGCWLPRTGKTSVN
jgi:stage III sporulation protein AA